MKEEFYSYSQMALGVEVYFTRIVDFTWRVSDCEENAGQSPSLSLIPQFSTTIRAAKLVDNAFSTFSCIDSTIPNPDINFTILLNWYSIRSL